MAQEFNSPFSPFGAPKPEEELLYPEQGMQFGGTGNSLFGTQPVSLIAAPSEQAIESARSGRYQQRQGELDRREPSIASDQIATPEVRAGRSQQRQGEQSQLSGFFEPGGFGYEYLGGRLGETIGQFVGEQKYGTGLDVEGGATGRPLNPRGLPGQTATLGASALELIGDYGIDPVVTAAQGLPEYVTGLDLTDSSLIDTPTAEVPEAQTAIPQIPQGAPGSPQAFFEEYRSKGPLTPEQISRGEAAAERMGRTFNPDTGFSQAPVQAGSAAPVTSGLVTQSGIPLSEFLSGAAIPSAGLRAESPMYADNSMSRGLTGNAGRAAYEAASAEREGRLAARMQQPGESITERDTRNAAARTQSSQKVPTDVREAMLTPEGQRTAKQINRLARWSGSTQGQEMGGVAGLEQILQPVDVDPQQQQYDEMRLYKLGLEIEKMQKEKPTEYQKAAAAVDEAIAAGNIEVQDRNKFILRDLGWQAKEGEYSQAFVDYINNLKPSDGAESGGEPTLVKTQEEYDNLAKGTRYIDADGNIATKK